MRQGYAVRLDQSRPNDIFVVDVEDKEDRRQINKYLNVRIRQPDSVVQVNIIESFDDYMQMMGLVPRPRED